MVNISFHNCCLYLELKNVLVRLYKDRIRTGKTGDSQNSDNQKSETVFRLTKMSLLRVSTVMNLKILVQLSKIRLKMMRSDSEHQSTL